jgi:hypothetical protein
MLLYAIQAAHLALVIYFGYFLRVAANVEGREYQKYMVEKALFTNTLIALPTGLGKTFIVEVVMYNYFRWFPEGNVSHCIVTVFFSDAVFYELCGNCLLKLYFYLQWKFRKNNIYLSFTSSCYSAN